MHIDCSECQLILRSGILARSLGIASPQQRQESHAGPKKIVSLTRPRQVVKAVTRIATIPIRGHELGEEVAFGQRPPILRGPMTIGPNVAAVES